MVRMPQVRYGMRIAESPQRSTPIEQVLLE
jgi:hypothetical protein